MRFNFSDEFCTFTYLLRGIFSLNVFIQELFLPPALIIFGKRSVSWREREKWQYKYGSFSSVRLEVNDIIFSIEIWTN